MSNAERDALYLQTLIDARGARFTTARRLGVSESELYTWIVRQPPEVRVQIPEPPRNNNQRRFQADELRAALARRDGVRRLAAQDLGVSRGNLSKILRWQYPEIQHEFASSRTGSHRSVGAAADASRMRRRVSAPQTASVLRMRSVR